MEGLTDCGVEEDEVRLVERGRWQIGELGELRHGGPGVDPVAIGRIWLKGSMVARAE